VLEMMANQDEADRLEMRKMSSILLLLYGDTAYLERERERTLLEKLVDMEEVVREKVSGTKRA